MIKHIRTSIFLLLLPTLLACSGTKNQEKEQKSNDLISVRAEEVKFPPSDVLQLKSYYLSSSHSSDSTDVIVGYNFKTHGLDYIDLLSKKISQVLLEQNGPSAILRLQGIYVQTLDSVWIYDESDCIFLINREGRILNKVNIRDQLNKNEQVLINTNHAMFTSNLHYDSADNALSFLIKDMSTSPFTFKVRRYFLSDEKSNVEYVLMPSVVEPNIDKGYANMNGPNVNYWNGKIIYNYPIESHIYILDTTTGDHQTIEADSRFTENKANKCKSDTDYSAWERHGIENPHFYDIMFLSKYGLYARLHLGEHDFDASQNPNNPANDRELYLMIFDREFNKMCETKLSKHRYNVFTGWVAINDGIVLYNNNILDTENNDEELRLDIIRPY